LIVHCGGLPLFLYDYSSCPSGACKITELDWTGLITMKDGRAEDKLWTYSQRHITKVIYMGCVSFSN